MNEILDEILKLDIDILSLSEAFTSLVNFE